MLDGLFGGGLDHFVIGEQQIVAAHARLAGETGGDDHDVGAGGLFVAVGSGNPHIIAFDRRGFQHVEALALRNAFDDIDQHHVGKLFCGDLLRRVGAHVARANDCYFPSHFL